MILLRRLAVLFFISTILSACGGKARIPRQTMPALTDSQLESSIKSQPLYAASSWEDTWIQLATQLQNDGLDPYRTNTLFLRLKKAPSHLPMGTKVTELYKNKFLPSPKPAVSAPVETKLGIPGPWFSGVVTDSNAKKCRDFISRHAMDFARAELTYGVPAEIAAALLFVETRLGTSLGKHDAFYMLASMAVTRNPESIPEYIAKLPGAAGRRAWIREKMENKADWAYAELRALLEYSYANNLDPIRFKGSVYGAIGLCQFMPSNLPRFGVDGNGDGVTDLFTVPDAVASLSNYLSRNGWKKGLSLKDSAKVLKRYNNMDIYAHTILALAQTIRNLK